MTEIKRCKKPFALQDGNMIRVVAAGRLVSTDDPAYSKATAANFEDIAEHVAKTAAKAAVANGGAPVEQATAEPGEKRGLFGRRGAPAVEPEVGEPVEDEPAAEAPEAPERPRGNAPRDEWAAYATARGIGFAEDAGQREIRAAVDAADSANEV